MRTLIVSMAIILSPVSAAAFSDSIVEYCFTTKDPHQCITSFLADERKERASQQRELQQRQMDAQTEQARIRAEELALFGLGAGYLGNLQQGIQNMQLPYNTQPYPRR